MIVTKKELDETDKRILKLIGEGMVYKEIGYEMNLSVRQVDYRVREMKKYYNCKSTAQLLAKLLSQYIR